eukprot:scaffold2.g7506.t1
MPSVGSAARGGRGGRHASPPRELDATLEQPVGHVEWDRLDVYVEGNSVERAAAAVAAGVGGIRDMPAGARILHARAGWERRGVVHSQLLVSPGAVGAVKNHLWSSGRRSQLAVPGVHNGVAWAYWSERHCTRLLRICEVPIDLHERQLARVLGEAGMVVERCVRPPWGGCGLPSAHEVEAVVSCPRPVIPKVLVLKPPGGPPLRLPVELCLELPADLVPGAPGRRQRSAGGDEEQGQQREGGARGGARPPPAVLVLPRDPAARARAPAAAPTPAAAPGDQAAPKRAGRKRGNRRKRAQAAAAAATLVDLGADGRASAPAPAAPHATPVEPAPPAAPEVPPAAPGAAPSGAVAPRAEAPQVEAVARAEEAPPVAAPPVEAARAEEPPVEEPAAMEVPPPAPAAPAAPPPSGRRSAPTPPAAAAAATEEEALDEGAALVRQLVAAALAKAVAADAAAEVKASLFTEAALGQALSAAWRVYWAHGPAAAGTGTTAGVAILVRKRALQQGLQVRGEAWSGGAGAAGRILSLRLAWGGHQLRLVNVYFPNEEAQQREFIAGPLQEAVRMAQGADSVQVQHVWAGDYNFVERPALDRYSKRDAAGARARAEARVAAAWRGAWQGSLVDAFRRRRPQGRRYTRYGPSSAARLDRFYVSSGLTEWVASAAVGEERGAEAGLSDHRPVTLALAARTGVPGAAPPRGPPRLRLRFLAREELVATLQGQLTALAAQAPEAPGQLLTWWPSFKRRVSSLVARQDKAARSALPPSVSAAWQQLQAAYEAVEAAAGDEAAAEAALAGVQQRRQELSEAVAAAQAEGAAQQRREWIHRGERPCPDITAKLAKPRAAEAALTLRAPNGALVDSPAGCAAILAKHNAAISARRPTEPAAQAEVLAALDGGWRPSEEEAAALGAEAVTAAQVARAAKRSRPGRAPGSDGIPLALYKHKALRDTFYPLLARLFSAIASEGRVPRGFLDGVIVGFFKSGDRADPGNYRPITLLNTDYKLLAKLLANRLAPLLPRLVDPEQTGFVRGRSIGENIHLLQLLPQLLAKQGRWALAVLVDFAKAYDTVDREFLLAAAERLGLGAGFVRWARLLLTDTRAWARVGGCTSPAEAFEAGVRQGCPLAPLLYLLVAQALLRLLKARGFGVNAAGRLLTAAQFADDCEALLEAPSVQELEAEVQRFLDAMGVFERASGQALSVPKTVGLPLGDVPQELPAALAGVRVVQEAKVLGVTLRAGTADPTVDWEQRVLSVQACFSRVARLGLSAFGRAFAAGGYALSQLLFQAEFAGLPPPAEVAKLTGDAARLVDRGLAPGAAGRRRFTHVKPALLPGRPAGGGFGLLPLVEHCQARWAGWLFRLVAGAGEAPWEAVAAELLEREQPGMTPLGLLAWAREPAVVARLPQPLRRWCEGARALPAVQLLAPAPQAPAQAEGGAVGGEAAAAAAAEAVAPPGWQAALPVLWSPLVPGADGHPYLAATHGELRDYGVRTLADLLAFYRQVYALPGAPGGPPGGRAAWRGAAEPLLGYPKAMGFFGAASGEPWREALAWLDAAVVNLPPDILAAAQDAVPAALPGAAEVEAFLARRLGWMRGGQPVPLSGYRVRHGTAMLLAPAEAERRAKMTSLVTLALAEAPVAEPPPGKVEAGLASLFGLLGQAWRVRWDNHYKETLWHLALNGLPVAARMAGADAVRCACGAAHEATGAPLGRAHHFWVCPVARAVVASLEAQLPLACRPLRRRALLLGEAPAGVHAGVWAIVCLAAVEALERSRRLNVRRELERREQARAAASQASQPAGPSGSVQLVLGASQDGQLALAAPPAPPATQAAEDAPPPLPPGRELAAALGARAVECMWGLLQEFCSLGKAPKAWRSEVAEVPLHPFLRWSELPPRPGWRVARPGG